jgi:hypothetical protein
MGEIDISVDEARRIFDSVSQHQSALTGFAVWKWDAKSCRWVKIKNYVSPGFDPGTGPTDPGRYDGQIIRWAGVVWND